MRFLTVSLLALVVGAFVVEACDIIVHVKSATTKKFQAQVLAPNGKKSEKWTLTNRQQQTFQQKASECSLGQWQIQTFADGQSAPTKSVSVTLNGIGRVLYTVGDDLQPVQTERQGAICTGQCAALGTTVERKSGSRSPSPTNS